MTSESVHIDFEFVQGTSILDARQHQGWLIIDSQRVDLGSDVLAQGSIDVGGVAVGLHSLQVTEVGVGDQDTDRLRHRELERNAGSVWISQVGPTGERMISVS